MKNTSFSKLCKLLLFIGLMLTFGFSLGQTKRVLVNWMDGGNSISRTFPYVADYSNPITTSSSMNYSGLTPVNDGRFVFTSTPVSSTLDTSTHPYFSFTINAGSSSIDLDRFVIQGYCCWTGSTSLRYSVDGFASHLGSITPNGSSYTLTSVNLNSLANITGTVEFRLYFYGNTSNSGFYMPGSGSAYTSIDSTPSSYGPTAVAPPTGYSWSFASFWYNYFAPAITTNSSLTTFSKCTGLASNAQTFSVSGSNLTSNIAIAALTGYEYSLDGITYTSTLSITPSAGTVTNVPVYVRLTSASTGTPAGNISISSTGATSQTIAVSGTVNALPTMTIGNISNIDQSATSFVIPFTATTSSPTLYSISSGTNALSGFTPVSDVLFSGTSGTLTIPIPNNSALGTYDFVLKVKNATTLCESAVINFTMKIALAPPTITSFSPLSGAVGSSITITGTGFNTTAANNIVFFDGVKAAVTASTATSLTVTVPYGTTGFSKIKVLNTATGIAYSKGSFTTTFHNGGFGNGDYNYGTGTFNGAVTFTSGATWQTTADWKSINLVIDYNNDGFPDYTSISNSSSSIYVYKNTITIPGTTVSTSTFSSTAVTLTATTTPSAIYSEDINGDGKMDIVVPTGSSIDVFINTSSAGTINFAAKQTFTIACSNRVRFGDINKDGLLDIISYSGAAIKYVLNTGILGSATANFGTSASLTSATTPLDFDMADFNNDGYLDILFSYSSGYYISLGSSSGFGSFTSTSGSFSAGSIVSGDLDNDGDIDFVVKTSTSAINYFTNNGSGVFSSASASVGSSSGILNGFETANFNGDAYPEVFASNANSGPYIAIFNNTTSSNTLSYAASTNAYSSSNPMGLKGTDVNGDGRPDIVAPGYYNTNYYVNQNIIGIPTISSFTPTSGSGGTSITITGTYFTGVTDVKINGVSATSFTVNSSTSITAVAPTGTTGTIQVITPGGTATSASNFTYTPTIVKTGTLTAFSKCSGFSSSAQTFTVSGSNLTANLVVAAYTGLEYSLDGTSYSSTLSITPTTGTVATTTIYVRMTAASASLTTGAISLTSTGATNQTVAVSGTVNALPTITLGTIPNATTLSTSFTIPYTAIANSPSLYSVSVGTNALSGFTPVVDTSFSGSAGNLTVTIPANSAIGTYDFNITVKNATTGCVSANYTKTLTITIPPPTITLSSNTLNTITNCKTPRLIADHTNVATDINLNVNDLYYNWVGNNVWALYKNTATNTYHISAVYPFTASQNSVNDFNVINPNPYFAAANFPSANPQVQFNQVTGEITIGGQNYPLLPYYENFTVSGTYLTAGITITPPSNFQISTDQSTWIGTTTTPTTITLSPSSGSVLSTTVYVRTFPTLAAGSYSGTNITIASTGATSVTKAVAATVYAPTVINTQPLTTKNICINASTGNSINLVASGTSLTYQWYSNSSNSNTGGTSLGSTNGAQTATLTINTSTAGTTYYYCEVSGSCGTVTSTVSAVTINPVSVAGTASASATTVCSGNTTTLSLVGSTGTIQWQSSTNNTTWTDVTGATTASYTTAPLIRTMYYRANVTSGSCTGASSNVVTITVPPAPYPYDRAVNFSSTGYLTKATTSSLGLTNFTVEAWIYPTAFNNYAGIIAKQDFQLLTATNGALAFMIERSWSWELRTSAVNVLTLNKWQHVAASYNASTKQMKMYVDGTLVDTYTRTQSFVPDFTTANLTVGYNNGTGNGSPSRNFAGNIDEVKVWNVVKTDTEISNNYANQLTGSETGLVAYYKFNQGIGGGNNTAITSLTDLTTNANHLTLSSMAMNGTTNNILQVGPAILSTPSICLNTSATLTHTNTGGTWSTSNASIISIDSNTGLATANSEGSSTITYTFTDNGCTYTSTKSFLVLRLPTITAQPALSAQNICLNGTATALSVTATGAGLTYQWYKNTTASNTGGTTISGATSATYTPLTTTVEEAYYYCIVSGTCAPSVTSNVSGLVKIYALSVAGTITSSVTNICDSGSTTLTLTGAIGTIQWQQFDNLVWTDLAGETNATFTTPTLTQNTTYRAVVINGPCSSTITSDFIVKVYPSPSAPTATTTINYCLGATTSILSATAINGYSLKWYTQATGGTASTTAPTPSASTVGTTTYYVSQLQNTSTVTTSTSAGTTTSYVSGLNFGQTFQVATTSRVNSIAIGQIFAYSPIMTMKIYDGFGGTLLGTADATMTGSGYFNPVFTFANSNVVLSANQTYYFEVTSSNSVSFYLMTVKTNYISTGVLYQNNVANSALDFDFTITSTSIANPCESPRTAITVNVNAIPTITGAQSMTVGGNTLQLTGSGTPHSTTPWTSSNPAAATISSSGVVTPLGGGSTTIAYTTAEGCSITATINVVDCNQPFGNALGFGVGTTAANADYVQINSRIFPSQSVANFTIETWVKPAASDIIAGTPGNTWLSFLGYSGTKRSPSMYITNNGVLHVSWTEGYSFVGSAVSASSPTTFTANKWTHVALVKDGTTMRVYVDGVQLTTVTCLANLDLPDNAYWLGKSDQQFSGALDEVRFWSTARTQAQIQSTMNTELVGNETGLLAYFDFNQGVAGGTNTAITTLTNKANNTINGTLTNFTRTGTTSNFVGNTMAAIDMVGPATICANSTAQYTHQIPGGTWSVSSGAAATVSTAGLVTTTTNETITLTYDYLINGCAKTATKSITIDTPTAPTVNSTIVELCQGIATTALTATANTGNTLQWYTTATGGTASTIAPTPSTTTVGSINYYVSQKNNTTNCESPRTAITINVNAIPTISGAQNMTVGGNTLQLTGSGTPNATTPWVSSNTGAATISSTGELSAVAAGSTTITYTNAIGCTKTQVITVIDCAQPFGNALNFDGVNDYLVLDNVGSNTAFQFANTTNYTLEAWVNRSAASSSASLIISKQNGGVAGNYSLGINTNGQPYVSREASPWVVNATTSIPLNQWTHIAGVFDGSSLKIYINGVLNNSIAASGNITPSSTTAIKVAIGCMYSTGTPSNFFNGSIDEARIWNVARTATQIQQNYLSQLQGNESGLVGYYNFNQGIAAGDNSTITTATNAVSSVSNGTLTNFTKNGTISNFIGSTIGASDIAGASSICASSTSQYTHQLAGGTWSVSNGASATISSSGLLTAAGAETLTITYTYIVNGCTFNATKAVAIVIPAITAQPATTAQNVCINGITASLSVTATGVNTTYQWYKNTTASTSGGTLIAGATFPVYMPSNTVAGTTYYYCVVSGTCTPTLTSDVSGAITISPASVSGTISGTASICSGATTTLTLTGNTGTVQWQEFDGSAWNDIVGATAITYTTPALTQNTSYRAVVASGYCTPANTTNFNVIVNPLPVISGPTSVGAGESITLSATTTAASSNAWVSSNTAVATINPNGVVTGLTSGTTTITYTNSNGCIDTEIITVGLGTTQPPVLTSPVTNTTGATTLNFNYTLPETPLAGSVTLLFTPTGGGTPITWTMTNATSAVFSYVVGTNPTLISNVVSGTALGFTTYDVTLAYQDAYSNPTASVTNTNIQTLAPPSISFANTNYSGLINQSIAIQTVNVGGGMVTYSIVPTLPTGLSLNTATGVISGTPTVTLAQTSFTVTATNAAGIDTESFNLFIDADTDGDGIGNTTDPDIDGDGTLNGQDSNPTNPCIGFNPSAASSSWNSADCDNDAIPNGSDADVDGNGTVDNGTDTDGDGINDANDPDIDGDGIPNGSDSDPDGNGTINNGPDTDGDGINDANDPDIDGDGIPNGADADANGDGTIDNGAVDTDGDGILDGADSDVNGDGVIDNGPDTDGDGVNDVNDPDIDGDGIPNGADVDPDGDGTNNNGTDTDGDGINDANDPDIDGDGIPNGADADPDGDGTNNNGTDTDGDGINDANDPDIDGDGIPNGSDADPDGDGTVNNGPDTDGDGINDAADADPDGDGTVNNGPDTDGDGVNDANDPDIDGDGIPNGADVDPDGNGTNNNGTDMDGDGINDANDTDIDGDGIPNGIDNCPNVVNPSVTTQPNNQAVDVCPSTTPPALTVQAAGQQLEYQWFINTVNSNVGGTAIAGATSATYTPSNTIVGPRYYYVVVYGTCGVVKSDVSGAITIQDITSPIVSTQNISVALNASGTASITASQINNGSTDNCSIASVTVSPSTFTCANVGTNTVTLTVTDMSGNTSSSTAVVTVTETILPVVHTQNISVQLNATGTASITAAQINNGSTDNCGIASMSVTPNTFTCANIGQNTVTLTVIDTNGNISTGTATVTVIDAILPTAIAQNVSVTLNAQGTATVTAMQVNNGSSDNCSIATMTISPSTFTCANIGANTVTLTVTDTSGNVSTASAVVTVILDNTVTGNNDLDAIPDNCDPDDDNDGILDVNDNCQFIANQDQLNTDNDTMGDICDPDDDNDGIDDVYDNCPKSYNPYQEDRDNDGQGDSCDTIEINVSDAISPNGDGINDTWVIYNIENHPNAVVKVFNRWGKEVFKARHYQNNWGGEFGTNTETLPEGGSYYYQIDLDGDGSIDKEGWLYISRK